MRKAGGITVVYLLVRLLALYAKLNRFFPKKSVQHLGTLKDLGYYLDTDLGGDQQYKVTLQRLTTALEAMKYKFPGTKGKEYAMRMVVMPRVGYTGQGANLTEY